MTQAHRPRKRFGQHFLNDPAVIERIMVNLSPRMEQHIVEIGPGQGALTNRLLNTCAQLDVIELDRDLIPVLEMLRQHCATLKIHQGDALKFNFQQLYNNKQPLRLIGNLPYNISTPLLFHLLEYSAIIKDMTFMLQKEVVERMAAKTGDRAYGRLSIMIQYRCQVEDLFHIGPQAFTPPPQVESAIVRLTPYRTLPISARDETTFAHLVRQAFSYRRKTLRNALKGTLSAATITDVGIDPTARPETVTLEEYVKLSNIVSATKPI